MSDRCEWTPEQVSPTEPGARVYRRTFEATTHPTGSEERARLNCDPRTSEYMPSYHYCVIGPHFQQSFRTRREAELTR